MAATVDDFSDKSFDFIICGGGTAGLVLAARLTENPMVTVGVIEAGKNMLDDMYVDTPALFSKTWNDENYDWIYKTEPQEGNLDRRHHIVRGKMLGGSSGLNFMMYVRGQKKDYDDWAELVGDESWSFSGMEKYFRKHETCEPLADSITDRTNYPFQAEVHGLDGPIRTSWNTTASFPVETATLQVSNELLDLPKPRDSWSGDHIGFYNTLGTVARSGPRRGKRSYAARGYYEPNKDRTNLKVLCEALVSRVIIDDDSNAVTGVEFVHGGSQYRVSANRDVIICGGTINSPQLLELSGIGDPEVLKAAGVECKVENRGVGNNYQDHFMCAVTGELVPDQMSADILAQPEVAADALKMFQEQADGPLTSISAPQGYFPYKKIVSPEELAETVQRVRQTKTETALHSRQLEKIIENLESDTAGLLSLVMVPLHSDMSEVGILDQSKLFIPDPNRPHAFAITIHLEYAAARGYAHIKSSNPNERPVINPRYFHNPADRLILASSMRFLDRMMNTEPLKSMVNKRLYPPAEMNLQDMKQAEAAAEGWIMNSYHPIGTCSMGEVVDSRLRFRGVRNLRVCDASVFPAQISGNIVGTVYAVAEKGADIIKEDHGL